MTDQPIVCAKCGYTNVPGDQFCGSCGAFLEWETAPGAETPGAAGLATSSGAVVTSAVPGPMPDGSGAGEAGSVAALGAAAPTAPQVAASPPMPPPGTSSTTGLLLCPACGIANPAGRTFCQSCGTKLAPSSAIPAKSREEIAAAVAAVPAATPRAPMPPGAGSAGAGSAAQPVKKGGLGLWVVAIIVLGVLAGVGFVLVPQLLKSSGPASAASAAPSASGAAAASGAVGSSGPSAAASGGSASPSAASSAPAGAPLKLTGASASSILGAKTADYGPQNAIDGSLKTSWQEGAAVEKGEWIEVSFDPATVTAVVIRDGFQASTALFRGNLRLKNILISVNGGAAVPALLRDVVAAQRIVLPPTANATTVRITIVDTYASIKTAIKGTPFRDAAVSEISVEGVAGG